MMSGRFRRLLRAFVRSTLATDTNGVTMVEYGLLAAMIALTAMASFSLVSNALQNALNTAQQNVNKN